MKSIRASIAWVLLLGLSLGCAGGAMQQAARRSDVAYHDARTASSQRTRADQIEHDRCELIERETGQSCTR